EVVEAGVGDRLLRRALAGFQRRQRHERLEGGTGRIGAVDGAVDHRLVRVVVQAFPVLGTDAVDEEVRVEGRGGYHGQDAAAFRLDGYQRTAAVAEGTFGDFLQSDVQRQRQVASGYRRRARQDAHGAATGIDLDLFVTGLAVQL